MRLTRIVALSAALLGLLVPAATAARPATQAEKRAITQAVLRTIPASTRPKVQIKRIRVTSVRLYGIELAPFAFANEVPKRGFEDEVQPQVFAVQRVPTASGAFRWVTVSYGTSGVGCGVVPLAYLRDLTGDRTPCPG